MKKKSDKELDLVELGLQDAYSGCYFLACSGICLVFGIAFSCLSRFYEKLPAFLLFLIGGILLVALSIALFVFGVWFFEKERKASEEPVLRCPIQEKKILRNGYIVSGVLLAAGIGVLIWGSLFFPDYPIHGAVLFAGSFVVLFYGSLLLVSTVRDHLIVKVIKN